MSDPSEIYVKYLSDQGVEFGNGLSIVDVEGERGIAVNQKVEEVDSVLAKIPINLLLTSETILYTPGPLSSSLSRCLDLLNNRLVLMLFLIYEKHVRGEESTWKSYLDIFPSRARSPLFFDEELELNRVAGTQLYSAVKAKWRTLEKEFAGLAGRFEELEGEGKNPFGSHFTLENFVWGDTMFRSRVFGIPARSHEVEKIDGMILLLDSLNHSQEPSVRWRIGEEEEAAEQPEEDPKFIYLKTTRPIEKGEVTVSYGDKSNEELLFQYGFAIPENPHDSVMILSPLSQEDPLFNDKLGLIQALNYGPRMLFGKTGEVSEKTKDIARITVLQDGDLEALGAKMDELETTGVWTKGMITPENETRMIQLLMALLEGYLDNLKSISFSESELASSLNLRFLECYRSGQVQVATHNLQVLAKEL